MKKFFKFAAIAAITAAFVSCTEKPGPEPTPEPGPGTTPEYTEDLTFTLEVAEVEADKAKIKVEHNGTTKDTWYGFATTESDVDKAIADVLEEGNVSLKKNTKTNVTVRNLEPETEYTFIAVGIKADGTTYGEPATVKFTTAKAEEPTPPAPTPGEYTINPNWTVTYIGDYEQDGKVYNNVIAVETTDTNPYFVTAWPVDYFEELGIATIVDEEIKAWEDLLAQYPGASWENDILYAESVLATVGIDPAYGTKWYAMAIGCDTNGNATGLYALSDVIDLENLGGGDDVEPTAEYSEWLGNWTFTGANGVAFDVTFSKGKVNESFIMTGWEGINDIPVAVTWLQEDQMWYINGQVLAEGMQLTNTVTGDAYFLPYAGDTIYDSAACVGGFTEDGTRVSLAYEAETEDGKVVMEGMGYWAFGNDGQTYIFSSYMQTGQIPSFPITITPATKATTTAVKEFKGGKKTLNPFAPKTFPVFGLCDMAFRTL
ncbi:MAG: hypothetical protein J6Q37_05220 [Bacteroidales bacterium]|nr:hypothetical protein [Bacteroidales bacterium]